MSNQPERSTPSRGSTGSTDSDDSPPSPSITPPAGAQAAPPSPTGSARPAQPGQQPASGPSSTSVDRAASSSGTSMGVTPGGSGTNIWAPPSKTSSFALPPGSGASRPPIASPSGTQTSAATPTLPNQANLAPTGPNVNQGIPGNVFMFAQPHGPALTPIGGTPIPAGTIPPPYPTPPPTLTDISALAHGGDTSFSTGTTTPTPTGTTAPAPGGGTTPLPVPAGEPTNPQGGGPTGAPAPPAVVPQANRATVVPQFMILDTGIVDTLAIYCVMPNCALMFPSRSEHDEHLKKDHGVERFRCLGCTNAYEKFEDLGRHVRHHHRKLNGNWGCPKGCYIYRTHNTLKRHLYRYHYKGLFKCNHTGCPFGPCDYRIEVYKHYYKEHKFI